MKKLYKRFKKLIKHQLLSEFFTTKGYITDQVINTNEKVFYNGEALDTNLINVLIKDWKFSDNDHCYLKSSDVDDITKYEVNDVCPLCDTKMQTITEVYSNKGDLGLQSGQCQSCGFVKHTRNFSQEWYANHFNQEWLLCDSDRENNVASKDLPFDEVSHLLKPNSDVADIGCGIGDRLKKFKDNGMIVHGCDPSNHRTKVASNFLNSNMKTMGGEEFFTKNSKKFDLVYFYTCLHFTEDPFLLIREAAQSLKENSYIYIVDSRYGYHNLFHAAHLGVARSYMSLKSINILAEQLELTIIKYDPEPFQIILTNNKSAKKCRLASDLDIAKYVNSELYPKRHTNDWLKVNYQPFQREIKFNIFDNNARKNLKKGGVIYPIRLILCDYQKAPVMLK